MKISRKFSVLILMVLGFAICSVLVVKLRAATVGTIDEQAVHELSSLQGVVSSIEVDFKTQVQEWKNILLRGRNSDDLKKYRSQFF